uniref:F-box domain-containing protein n=1 Tax=Aegilops tauschii TaxID=37682 RepID=M8C3Q8_AEGTA
MGGGRRCRKNSRRGSPPAAEIDVLLDDLLELVFLRLPSPANLVRAASTCKRWRRVIAGDGGGLLRRYGTLHGASDDVVGHYCVDDCDGYPYRRRPSLDPVFVPSPSSSSPWADTVAARNLALDFLPRGEFGDSRWELADIRGGLLLVFDRAVAPRLLICDPLRRCYREIPRSAWFHGCHLLGAFLLDGEDADAGISMSNFRVSCMLYCFRNRNGSVKFRFWSRGSDDGSADWTVGDNILLSLDKDAAELTCFLVVDDEEYAALREKRHPTGCSAVHPFSTHAPGLMLMIGGVILLWGQEIVAGLTYETEKKERISWKSLMEKNMILHAWQSAEKAKCTIDIAVVRICSLKCNWNAS